MLILIYKTGNTVCLSDTELKTLYSSEKWCGENLQSQIFGEVKCHRQQRHEFQLSGIVIPRSMNSVLVLTACNNSCLNREITGPYCSSSYQGCGSRHFYWIIDHSPGLPPFLFAAGLANRVCLCSSITALQDAHKRFSAAGC